MDGIINVKVSGSHLSKDNKNAGVRGEGNVTMLRITFDEGWKDFSKTVVFYDAHGNNPVKRIQGVDLIKDITKDTLTYVTPIPEEPLKIAGEMTFVIEGYTGGKRKKSLSDTLIVKDSPDTGGAKEPIDPIPEPYEQIQQQIDGIIGTIQQGIIASQNASAASSSAIASEINAKASENNAKGYAEDAKESAESANLSADKAENAISHNPVIINGYWHIWSAQKEEYINTEIKAQAGSEVYVGTNPPDSADVWIDLDGESALYAPYIGENGNWYTFNPETQTFTDSGNRAVAQDGVSCTHSWNGTTLTVKSASGESSANLKGEKGDKGDKGATGAKGDKGDKGDKGEKGDTYTLTAEDKTDIGNDVSDEIEAELNACLDTILDIQEELLIPDGDGVKY